MEFSLQGYRGEHLDEVALILQAGEVQRLPVVYCFELSKNEQPVFDGVLSDSFLQVIE